MPMHTETIATRAGRDVGDRSSVSLRSRARVEQTPAASAVSTDIRGSAKAKVPPIIATQTKMAASKARGLTGIWSAGSAWNQSVTSP